MSLRIAPPPLSARLLGWGWRRSAWLGVAPFLIAVTVLGRAAQNVGQTTFPIEGHQLLGVGNGLLGTMAAVGGLVSVVASATVGARATRSNALRMLATGQAMILTALVAFAVPWGGTAALWAGAVLVWCGGGLMFPATMTAIGTERGGNASRGLAVFALGLSVGLTVGPLIEAGILRLLSESLRATFGALLVVPAAATALAALGAAAHALDREPGETVAADPPADPAGDDEDRTEEASGSDDLVADGIGWVAGIRRVATRRREIDDPGRRSAKRRRSARPSLLRLPAYRLSLAALLTYRAPFSALVAFGGLLATRGDGTTTSGAVLGFAAFYTMSFLVRAAVVRLSPVRHLRMALTSALVATAAGIAVLGTAHRFSLFVVGMVLLGAPHGLTLPLASSVLAEHVDHDTLGRANARVMASSTAVGVVVPLLCGLLATAVGYHATFLLVEVPVAVLGTVLVVELVMHREWSAGHRRVQQ